MSVFRFAVALLLSGVCGAQELKKEGRVMSWVPPYAVGACRERLDESFDGVGMKTGLTHLGLQFWQPTKEGGLVLVDRFKAIDDSTILDFRKWGEAHGVRVMLCVYNGAAEGWDWELAKSAFGAHREQLIEALVSETVRLKLDGVDIDFEGKGNRKEDKEAFVRFIKELSERLHAKGKELTVDTFAYKWHAPNQEWWPELLPHVDGLHVMGYSETGVGADDWRSYELMKSAAGDHASKLVFGMLSSVSEWQGKPAIEHLAWVREEGSVGLAVWDVQLKSPAWRRKGLWEEVGKIRGRAEKKSEKE